MRKLIGFITISFVLGACSSSIQVVDLKRPDGSLYPSSQTEPSIAIDPNNTLHVVAGAILDEFYESFDGGLTWASQNVKSTYGVYGDPVMMFDTASMVYYFHLASYEKTSHLDRIV